jgi:hypothetical protein
MPHIPIALNQLPDDIDALKSLVAEQVARYVQRQASNRLLNGMNNFKPGY